MPIEDVRAAWGEFGSRLDELKTRREHLASVQSQLAAIELQLQEALEAEMVADEASEKALGKLKFMCKQNDIDLLEYVPPPPPPPPPEDEI